MKESISSVAINNDCMRKSGMQVDMRFADKNKNLLPLLQFVDRTQEMNCAQFTNQKCVPSTNPNVEL